MRTLRTGLLFVLIGFLTSVAAADPAMRVEATARQADGKIVFAGQAGTTPDGYPQVLIGRLNADGSTDTAFGTGGSTFFNAGPVDYLGNPIGTLRATAVAIGPSGDIFVGLAYGSGYPALVRLSTSGAVPLGYGPAGASPAMDTSGIGFSMNALHAQADGSLIAVGSYVDGGTPAAALVHYDVNGMRDTSFGSGPFGTKLPNFNATQSELRAVADRGDGGFVTVGYRVQSSKRMLIAAFTAAGDLDSMFGPGLLSPAGSDAFGVVAKPGWGFLVVGRDEHSIGGTPANNVILAKTMPDGSPDYSFGYGGYVQWHIDVTDNWDASDAAVAVDLAANGDILVGGTATRVSDGHDYFFAARMFGGGYSYSWIWSKVAPRTPGDDNLVGAYADGNGNFVAIGTRAWTDGQQLARVRYLEASGDVDYTLVDPDDTTPDPFEIAPVNGAGPSAAVDSVPVTVTGIGQPVAVAITGGAYSVGCVEPYTSAPGAIANLQQVCVRTTSSSSPLTATAAYLTVGGLQVPFVVTTGSLPETFMYNQPTDPTGSTSASFYFYNDEQSGPVTFECSLDGAPFTPCGATGGTTHADYTGLAAGTHAFQVRAVNGWGSDPTPASWTWTIVTVAQATITSNPSNPANLTTATFAFTASGSSSFECSLDAAAYAPCASPKTYTGLGNGAHTFRVRALNAAGTGPAAPYDWSIDTIPPNTAITASVPTPTRNTTSTIGYSGSDNSGLPVTFECQLDNGAWAACPNGSVTVTVSDGTHTIAIRAVDAAGNFDATPATTSWTVDSTPPDTSLTSAPSGTVATRTAAFTYSSPDFTASFECSLDGETFSICSSGGRTYTAIPDGVHAFAVRARDPVGNVDPTPASATWTVDMPPPDTTISSGPSGTITTTNASFSFSSNDLIATFECSMDGAAFLACSNNVQYAALAQGAHLFQVRARTSTKVDGTPAQRSFAVDTVAPETTITSAPAATGSSTSATIAFTADEPATFQCALDAAAFAPCTSPVTYQNLALGTHSFQARATDSVGHVDATPATVSWSVVDNTPPETTLLRTPEAATPSTTAQFDWASNETGVSYEYRLDGAAWVATTGSTKIYDSLAPGTHTFDVRAIDAAANIDPTPASWTWTIDQTAPDSTILTGPAGTTAQTSATFTFASNEASATFTCFLDGGAGAACTSPTTYAGLADGAHSFGVLARDAAGNLEQQAPYWSWTVDTSAPDTSIASGPSGTVAQSSATFTFSATDASATFECAIDSGAFTACTSGASYTGLGDGMHIFEVRARDAAGNVDAMPASRTWSVDTTAPGTTITQGPPAITSSTTATFAFSATEGATFMCKLDGAASFSACSSPLTFASLASASHSFSVYAIDSVGNADASPATWSWIVDAVAPDTSITGGPSGNNNPNTATFTFTSSETGSTFECKLDAGAFAACASPTTYNNLPRGSHTFQVRATDAAGNVDATPATRNWNSK